MFSSWLTEPEIPGLLHSELPTAHDGVGDKDCARRERGRANEGMERNVEKKENVEVG